MERVFCKVGSSFLSFHLRSVPDRLYKKSSPPASGGEPFRPDRRPSPARRGQPPSWKHPSAGIIRIRFRVESRGLPLSRPHCQHPFFGGQEGDGRVPFQRQPAFRFDAFEDPRQGRAGGMAREMIPRVIVQRAAARPAQAELKGVEGLPQPVPHFAHRFASRRDLQTHLQLILGMRRDHRRQAADTRLHLDPCHFHLSFIRIVFSSLCISVCILALLSLV